MKTTAIGVILWWAALASWAARPGFGEVAFAPSDEALAAPSSRPAGEESDESPLDALVADFFRQPQANARKRLVAQINELVGGDVDPVTAALDRVQLWSPQAEGPQRIQVETGADRITDVVVRVPPGYDHTRRYPLILALHGLNGRGEGIIGYLRHLLGERLDEFIVAAPTDYKGHWFNSPLEESGDPTALLADLRRRYHLDAQRVYAVGYSMGGHAAFTLAVFFSDQFAAVVSVAGTFVVPWSNQAFALLLPNVNNLPVLAVWGEKDTGDDNRKVAPGGGIAGHNRRIRALAAELNLPIRTVELKGVGHGDAMPPDDLLRAFLAMRREDHPREFVHWFRYPAQGRAAWVRQIRYAGHPWQGTQIAVATTGRLDVDQYVTGVFKKKLAYLSGRIEGQHIQVEVRKTAELEVLLNDELVDLDEPITLLVGDKKRYQGRVRRKVATLLETAYRDWDFQRLYTVRLVMRARSKARQD